MKSLINLRALAALQHAASHEDTRYYLNGVYVTIDADGATYVATDSQVLAAWRDNLKKDDEPNTLLGSWIIPNDTCAGIKINRLVDPFAQLTQSNDSELRIDSVLGPMLFEPINGTFPDWKRVIPDPYEMKGPLLGVTYNPYLLVRLTDVERTLSSSKKKTDISIPILHPTGAPYGDPPHGEGQGATLVRFSRTPDLLAFIMPMRAGTNLNALPAWFSRD